MLSSILRLYRVSNLKLIEIGAEIWLRFRKIIEFETETIKLRSINQHSITCLIISSAAIKMSIEVSILELHIFMRLVPRGLFIK